MAESPRGAGGANRISKVEELAENANLSSDCESLSLPCVVPNFEKLASLRMAVGKRLSSSSEMLGISRHHGGQGLRLTRRER